MRIGVNALYLLPGRVGGTEIYLRELLAALAAIDRENDYFVYVNAETDAALVPSVPRFHCLRCHVRAHFRLLRISYEQLILPLLLARGRIDVLFNPGFTAPLLAPCPSVTVFHDLQHKRHPEFFRRIDLPFWNILLWLAARRSRRIIAVSAATAGDLALFYPFVRDRISIVHHGVNPEFFAIGLRRGKTKPSRDLLAVSTLHPHKNIERLLHAFRHFHRSHTEYRLVIVGLRGFAAVQLENCARDLGLHSSVSFTGWIPRPELFRLFENACAFISPSLFEGFGMPIVEALAAGIPVAISRIPALEEVAGGTALCFDPYSVDAIAGAIEQLTADRGFRAEAQHLGPERARVFSWENTAKRTLSELIRAAG